jgi:DNA polymerase-3 subunit alpha
VEPWTEQERLAREKESVGFFISGHPLDRFRDLARAFGPVTTGNLGEFSGQDIELPCVVTKVARQIMRKDNSEWGKLTVEDFAGTASVLAFGEAWTRAREIIERDSVILLSGTVSNRERDEDDPPIFLDRVEPLEAVSGSGRVSVAIEMAGVAHAGEPGPVGTGGDLFAQARAFFELHPGAAPVEIHVMNGPHETPRLRSRKFKVRADQGTLGALRDLFGAGRVHLVRTQP